MAVKIRKKNVKTGGGLWFTNKVKSDEIAEL